MNAAASLDLVLVVGGWAAGLSGAGVLLWALFRDRARGRRRCPRCWYDMAGVREGAALVCPECGQASRTERALLRTRRRWRWAGAAAVLILAGLVAARVPAYRHGGWIGAMPGTVLVLVAPVEKGAAPAGPATIVQMTPGVRGGPVVGNAPGMRVTITGNAVVFAGAAPLPAAAPASVGERLYDEAWSRVRGGALAKWQSELYLSRHFKANPADRPDRLVSFPQRWPEGTAVAVRGASNLGGLALEARVAGGAWVDVSTPGVYNAGTWVHWLGPGTLVSPAAGMELRLLASNGAVVYDWSGPAPVTVGGSTATFLEQLKGPEHDRTVLAALRPRVVRLGDRLVMAFRERSSEAAWQGIDFGVFFTAELVCGEVVARGEGFADWSLNAWEGELGARLAPVGGADLSGLTGGAGGDGLTLVIRGNPQRAGESYIAAPFRRPRAACWAGELVIPVERIEVLQGAAPGPAPRE